MHNFIKNSFRLVALAVALPLAAQELIKEGGFEQLRADGMPNGPAWAWRNSGSKDLKIELSATEKSSGNSSLHLVDADRGNTNDGLTWMMAGNELPHWAGKTLKLSCRIKQVKANGTKKVGIGYWLKQKNGKMTSGFAGPESAGETVWTEYNLVFTVPADAEVLLVTLHCANGWGGDAEAYFDDFSLVPASAAAMAATEKKAVPMTGIDPAKAFYFFHDSPLPLWQTREWGGLYLEQSAAAAGQGERGLKVATVKGSQAYAGIGLSCSSVNRLADLSAAPADAELFFMVKPYLPLQIQLADKTMPVTDAMKSPAADGWTMVRMPLAAFWNNGKPGVVNNINLQFTVALPAGTVMMVDELGVSGMAGKVKTDALDPAVRAKAEKLCQGLEQSWTSDAYSRPEIRNGTFYFHGKPTFMLGPWIDDMLLNADFGAGSARECAKGTIYERIYDPTVAAELGTNSFQLSAAARLPMLHKLALPWDSKQVENAEALKKMFSNLNGMPFIQDYAWINWTAATVKAEKPANAELLQKNTEWHEFIPYCPEHPKAVEIYATYFRTGAAFALANGANPYIHEIFNESNYHCSCKFNRENFAREMEKAFKDIAAANRAWQTPFRSFAELATLPHYEKFPAVWAEWCGFQSRRYAAVLRQFGQEIKKVDRRPNVYLTEQLHVASIFRTPTMDYRLIAAELDVLTCEGGWQFGQPKKSGDNPWEEAMRSSAYPFVADFYAALSKGKKPVVNNEHYCVRTRFGKRLPSKKEDLLTAMWSEVFHDVSGSYPYAWCKRVWEWKTLQEAKEGVYDGGYKASNLLNPYNWPRQSLDGFKEFATEAAVLAEVVLPQPRRAPASVALVYSYASMRQASINQENIEKLLLNCYFSLLYSQYPVEIVFADEMTADNLRRFDAVVLPAIRNATPQAVATLQAYASGGGLVVCAGKALLENEYAQPLDASALLGLNRNGGKVTPRSASAIKGGWHNRLGKGNVYYLEKNFDDAATAAGIPALLQQHRTSRYFTVQPLDGKTLTQTEAQLIDRGKVKLLLLVNWEDRGSRLVKLSYNGKPVTTPLYASLPVSHEQYLGNTSQTWDDKSLRDGMTLVLPPQTRTLLLLSTDAPTGITCRLDQRQVEKQFKNIQAAEAGEQAAITRQEDDLIREAFNARNYAGVKTASCVPLNITRQAITGFREELAGDKQGGWFDQGNNDYRQMPLGTVRLAGGVPFEIIDPAGNQGRAAIALRGGERPYFAEAAKDIAVDMKTARLYVLHAAGWEQKEGEPCYFLKINFADGSSVRVPAPYGEVVGGWWNPKPLPGAKIAHESANAVCKRIGLYCWRIDNPQPDREIKSLDLEAAKGQAVPIIVAITAEK